MKKLTLFSMIAAAALLIASCTKEKEGPMGLRGVQGDQGYPGKDGATGAQGPAGSANVQFSAWTADSTIAWTDTTIASTPYKYSSLVSSALTQGVMDSGAVFVYAKLYSDSSVNQLPLAIYGTNGTNFDAIRSVTHEGKIALLHSYFSGRAWQTPAANLGAYYRFIVIPGSVNVSTGRLSSGAAGYTLEQLRNMKYDQLVTLLGITR